MVNKAKTNLAARGIFTCISNTMGLGSFQIKWKLWCEKEGHRFPVALPFLTTSLHRRNLDIPHTGICKITKEPKKTFLLFQEHIRQTPLSQGSLHGFASFKGPPVFIPVAC